MANITVLNGCADALFNESLRSTLDHREEIHLVDNAWNNEAQLLSIARDLKPHVFLMEGPVHSNGEASLLLRMRAASPETKSILFFDSWTRHEVMQAIGNGAKGCIGKTPTPGQLLKAILVIHLGDIWVDRKLLAEALVGLLQNVPARYHSFGSKPDNLTEREWEVVRWFGQGMTNKEIARQLRISDTTVKTHLQHVFGKLNIGRRSML